MNRDTIKYIAIITMFINHVGYIFIDPPLKVILMDIGYFAAITMCYFLVEGYQYTRSKKKYGTRLLIFALVSQIPYSLAMGGDKLFSFNQFNMIFNLFFCFLIIHVHYTVEARDKRIIYTVLLMGACLFCDWSIMAPVYTILFVRAGNDKNKQAKAWIQAILFWGFLYFLALLNPDNNELGQAVGSLVNVLIHTLWAMAGPAAAAICILCFYNGKKSEHFKTFNKWFFYIFYPAHLLVLGLIRIKLLMG